MSLFLSGVSDFLQTAGVIFAGLATMCGLALGYASVIESAADRSTVSNAAEKLLHATLYLLFASLLGFFAIKLEDVPGSLAVPAAVLSSMFRVCGFWFLGNAFWAAHYGLTWLSDVLYARWGRRAS